MKNSRFENLYAKLLNEAVGGEDVEDVNLPDAETEPAETEAHVPSEDAPADAEKDETETCDDEVIKLVLKKEDFCEPAKFEEILVVLNIPVEKTSDEDEVVLTMTCKKEDVLEEDGVGMGSAGYVEASVSNPGASNAVFVPFKGMYTIKRIPAPKLVK